VPSKDWRAYNKAYYAKNRERQRARAAKWAREDRDRVNAATRKRRAANPEKARADVERWKQANPEKWRKMREGIVLRARCKRYGITVEQYFAMLEAQHGVRAICQRSAVGTKAKWHIDHDHETHEVRGLLCHHCNTALGHVRDSIDVLRRMIEYLES
jgi:hypothetical protein